MRKSTQWFYAFLHCINRIGAIMFVLAWEILHAAVQRSAIGPLLERRVTAVQSSWVEFFCVFIATNSTQLNWTQLNWFWTAQNVENWQKLSFLSWVGLSWVFLSVHSDKLTMNTLSTQRNWTEPNSTGQLSWVEFIYIHGLSNSANLFLWHAVVNWIGVFEIVGFGHFERFPSMWVRFANTSRVGNVTFQIWDHLLSWGWITILIIISEINTTHFALC